jgi:hypothetical protein
MEHMLSQGPLLDEVGNLKEAGYSFALVKDYHRKDIKAGKSRIKEWDYYYIGNHKHGIALTIDDNSYMSLCSVTIFDFEKKSYIQSSTMHLFTFGKVGLPETSEIGNTTYCDKRTEMYFENDGKVRHLHGVFHKLEKGKDLTFDITLTPTTNQTMVIATPFKKEGHFYYNQKRNNLKASGGFDYDGRHYDLSDAYGVLDWGRGVWTYENTWYWSSLNDYQDGHTIGFNLGYGFGDTSAASENMFFYDDKAYKLGRVKFNIPQVKEKDSFLDIWTITSEDQSVCLNFHPLFVRKGGGNMLFIKSDQNQVYGYFNGTIKVDGDTIVLRNLLGFAEKVYNRW